MYIDTHCHLDAAEFDVDRAELIAAAQAAGVETCVVPAVRRANFGAVLSLCREYSTCLPALGVHPLHVGAARPEDLAVLRELLARHTVVAIGEIGLDRHARPRNLQAEALQEHWFIEQLKLAREFDLPVLLHVRHAVDAVLQCLRRHPVAGGIAHAFNGSAQQAAELISLGFKLGFGGAMTYPRARRIRQLAASLPLDALVLETDAPDMPPSWLGAHEAQAVEGCVAGVAAGLAVPVVPTQDMKVARRNAPTELPRIAATLAELRAVSVAEIACSTSANARAILRLAA